MKCASAGTPDGPSCSPRLLVCTISCLLLTASFHHHPAAPRHYAPMVLSTALGLLWLSRLQAALFAQSFSNPYNKRKPGASQTNCERWYTGQREENPNSSWKILQLQLDPDRDGSRGIITGEGRQLHCTHKQSCKRELLGRNKFTSLPPAYRLFQCQGAPNLLEKLAKMQIPGLDA